MIVSTHKSNLPITLAKQYLNKLYFLFHINIIQTI